MHVLKSGETSAAAKGLNRRALLMRSMAVAGAWGAGIELHAAMGAPNAAQSIGQASDVNANVVLAHGAWADGSSWSKVIVGLNAKGVKAWAAPLPLTSLADDIAALDRMLDRVDGPIVLAGHAYAGAVIAGTRSEKVKRLVYVTALAPDEGETVADVFYRAKPDPKAPKLAPDDHGLIWLPEETFAAAFAPNATAEERVVLAAVQRPIAVQCIHVKVGRPLWREAKLVLGGGGGSDDPARDAAVYGGAHESSYTHRLRRSYPDHLVGRSRRRYHPRGDRRGR
jgi:hypothetical protein